MQDSSAEPLKCTISESTTKLSVLLDIGQHLNTPTPIRELLLSRHVPAEIVQAIPEATCLALSHLSVTVELSLQMRRDDTNATSVAVSSLTLIPTETTLPTHPSPPKG